ncbi:MAG: GatB/YqeY domain-containing protein [Flavobacteriales bacterium]|jgi:uncharacterized protein YqeY|nr:GatB/YqeY domain-containing protein [Flavobacteriales bacterium]
MSLTAQINGDIKQAMLAKEKEKLAALRAIKAALLLEATKEGNNGEITEAAELSILQKLYKQRTDASKIYIEQGREDLANEENFQASVIKAYLPEQMSEAEITKVVKEIIASVGASSPSDMGKVMGPTMGRLKGKADGNLISKIVKQELS